VLSTPRLRLVPVLAETLRAAIAGREQLSRVLSVCVPDSWPPEYLDEGALQYTLDRLVESPESANWWAYFVVRAEPAPPTLIGCVGYKGLPREGAVEVGYGIVADQRRQGYATEATAALIDRAFEYPGVDRVLAETLPELVGSVGVMQRCGMRFIGEGSEHGVIRYELTRAEWEGRKGKV